MPNIMLRFFIYFAYVSAKASSFRRRPPYRVGVKFVNKCAHVRDYLFLLNSVILVNIVSTAISR